MNVGKTEVMKNLRRQCKARVRVGRKQQQNVEYFSCRGNMITKGARCTREITPRIAMAKTTFNWKGKIHTVQSIKAQMWYLFLLSDKQNYIDTVYGCYSILLHVSAVHLGHYQAGHLFT
jgi:hypothetical protein